MKAKTVAALAVGALAAAAVRNSTLKRRMISFQDKTVLITGGSRGLGLVLARKLLQEGATVLICARDAEELQSAKNELKALGQVETYRCDLTDEEDIRRMVEQIKQQHGVVDVLINNAGLIAAGPLESMTEEDYRQLIALHLTAPILLCTSFLEAMKEQGSGRIVNISSIGGRVSVPHLGPYSASKFGLTGFSRALRAELQKYNVFVTTVCPGMMRTGSHQNASFKGQHRLEQTWFSVLNANPLLSVSAEYAAEKIVEACRRGDAELVIGIAAKAAAFAGSVFPGLTQELLALGDRLLPGYGGIGTRAEPGYASQSAASPSILTRLSDSATDRNNERSVQRQQEQRESK